MTDPAPRSLGLPHRTRVDFWLDVVLAVAFVVDSALRFTGLAVHEWLGIGFGVALLGHLALHWDWVLRITRRLLHSLGARDRVRWLVDLGLLGAMTLCVASGVAISRSALPAMGLATARDPFWTGLHHTTSDLTVLLAATHVGLSWRWITGVVRRLAGRGASTAPATTPGAVT